MSTAPNFDPELVRREYDFLDEVIFVDMCSVVMPPRRVQNAYGSFMKEYVNALGRDLIADSHAMVGQARTTMAALISAHPHEIGFTKNTCEGISILASGYPFAPGDNVVISDLEHPSNALPWVNAQRRGVDLRVVPSTGAGLSVADLMSSADDRTRIIAVSAAQFSTGFLIGLETLGAECRRRGIVLAVDAIQALGRVPMNVQAMNIDFLAAGGNKGLLATLGAGFAYCSDRIVSGLVPPYAGYQSVANEAAPPARISRFDSVAWHSDARRMESGNLNYNGINAMAAGVGLLLELGVGNIAAWTAVLETELRSAIADLPLDVIAIDDPANRCGTVCLNYAPTIEGELLAILARHKVYATVRGGWLRISIGFYNTLDQMRRLAGALTEISQLAR
jgi:cysteine desulfurase/selenocysteine lyase